jgi:hypothetical protein
MNILDRQSQLKELERIETLTQSEKWLAIRTFMWNYNPQNRIDDQLHCKEVARRRNFESLKLTGASKSGSFRALVSLPEYLYLAIKAADPEFYAVSNSKNKQDIRQLQRRLWTTFPSYRLASKF